MSRPSPSGVSPGSVMPSNARRSVLLAACLATTFACAACNRDASPTVAAVSTVAPTPTPTHALPDLSVMLAEKSLGSASAPVTMIEYSSLTCSHCADYHLVTFPQIKATHVDTGQVKYIARDFPLNDPSLAAAMVARCAGSRYFDVTGRLFQLQANWGFSSDWKTAMKQVVAPLDITSDDVDACLARQDLLNGIAEMKNAGTVTQGVNATPTFVINGRKIVGALSFAEFDAAIRSALGQ
jgi:protein-disulfide isomerase